MFLREDSRQYNELRPIEITRNFTKYAEGSVFIKFGNTCVLCNATVDESVPAFLKGKGTGWLTAEYSMLPRSTHSRIKRYSAANQANPRAVEISRLIGRSLRASLDLDLLGERQIIIDCDVIQADGGTRTASITGAFIALQDAISKLVKLKVLAKNPIKNAIAAVSVGLYQDQLLLDLDYNEDSNAAADINVVMLDDLSIVEIQATAEKTTFSRDTFNLLIDLSQVGIMQLLQMQKAALNNLEDNTTKC